MERQVVEELDPDDDWEDDAVERTYVLFTLAGDSYAIPVLNVREILRLPPIAAVPDLPAYMCGAANLRGNVVPVIDMRRRFALAPAPESLRQVLILVEVERELTALCVDAVSDAVEIREEQLDRRTCRPEGAVLGLARRSDEEVDIVLDLPALTRIAQGAA